MGVKTVCLSVVATLLASVVLGAGVAQACALDT
jgi:hypothetical protein